MSVYLRRFFIVLVAGLGLGLGITGIMKAAGLQFVVGTVLMAVAGWLDNNGFGEKRA